MHHYHKDNTTPQHLTQYIYNPGCAPFYFINYDELNQIGFQVELDTSAPFFFYFTRAYNVVLHNQTS